MIRRRPTTDTPAGIDRRTMLRNGGLAVGVGALLSACAKNFGGDTAPGRVGVADEATSLPDGEINDVVLVRTMQSLEHSVAEALRLMTEAGGYSAALQTYVDRFAADHAANGAALGALAEANGGESYACPNTWFMSRYVEPMYGAVASSDDVQRDCRAATHALETMLAHSYQFLVGLTTGPEHRRQMMLLGAGAARRSAMLAAQVSAGTHGYLGPSLNADAPETDGLGFPIPYAVPSTFGRVDQVPVVVGAVDDEGSRFSTTLQTPAENTFVYDYLSC